MIFPIPHKAGNSLSSWTTISFSRMTLPMELIQFFWKLCPMPVHKADKHTSEYRTWLIAVVRTHSVGIGVKKQTHTMARETRECQEIVHWCTLHCKSQRNGAYTRMMSAVCSNNKYMWSLQWAPLYASHLLYTLPEEDWNLILTLMTLQLHGTQCFRSTLTFLKG
jgi:hypothetical protein